MKRREYYRQKYQKQGSPAAGRLRIHPQHISGIIQNSLSDTTDDSSGQKCFPHLRPQIECRCDRLYILLVFLLLLRIRLYRICRHMRNFLLFHIHPPILALSEQLLGFYDHRMPGSFHFYAAFLKKSSLVFFSNVRDYSV